MTDPYLYLMDGRWRPSPPDGQHHDQSQIPSEEDLSLFSRLVYDAPRPEDWTEEDDWTFEQWQEMQPPQVISAFLKHSTQETVAIHSEAKMIETLLNTFTKSCI